MNEKFYRLSITILALHDFAAILMWVSMAVHVRTLFKQV